MLKRLAQARGVSGNEGEVRKIVLEAATPLADEILVDSLGSVIATKKGTDPNAPTVMLCAHMDEVGLIVRTVQDNGLLRYATVGGIDPVVMVSKRVKIGKNAVPGIIGSKAVHLQAPGERSNPFKHSELYIDIGASSKEDALKLVAPGDYATFDSDFVPFGDGLVKSRALDDRVGCYALLKILEERYPCTIVAAFVVQEEVGLRGSTAAAHRIQPDMAIVLEGTSASDVSDSLSHQEVCCVGKGPAISFMDNASIANYPLMLALREAAETNNIPWQIKRYVSGGNDAGAIQKAGPGARTCVISVPCRYIHSPASVCSLADVEHSAAIAMAYLRTCTQIPGGN